MSKKLQRRTIAALTSVAILAATLISTSSAEAQSNSCFGKKPDIALKSASPAVDIEVGTRTWVISERSTDRTIASGPTTGQLVFITGSGEDRVRSAAEDVHLIVCTGGGEDIIDLRGGTLWADAGDHDDIIDASGPGNHVILAGAHDDFVYGGRGTDRIDAGDGEDYVDGGAGNDIIYGGRGNDELDGGRGNDRIMSGSGSDKVDGESGTDLCDRTDGARPGRGDTYTNCETMLLRPISR